jgi:UDP-N-acetylglucosamine 2-epimerase (non-hydrolysing)
MRVVHLVAAARPNFMKVAPVLHELRRMPEIVSRLIHTGQHYDANMSDAFFRDLRLPAPDHHLGVGSGSHAEQTAKVMLAYDEVLRNEVPDLVIVPGDVNSTLAVTLTSAKMGVRIAHLEAGLRSYDRRMPEELNRIVTDSIADKLWTPSQDADENLLKEGVSPDRIECVGNVMIDSLEMLRGCIDNARSAERFGLEARKYAVATIHRPSNVDEKAQLLRIVRALEAVARVLPVVFPIHPRTARRIKEFDIRLDGNVKLILLDPLSYIEFVSLVSEAALVITDSGGIQEETSYLDIPCLTLRETTERPITVLRGTNTLCRVEELMDYVAELLCGRSKRRGELPLWDGKTASRILFSVTQMLR